MSPHSKEVMKINKKLQANHAENCIKLTSSIKSQYMYLANPTAHTCRDQPPGWFRVQSVARWSSSWGSRWWVPHRWGETWNQEANWRVPLLLSLPFPLESLTTKVCLELGTIQLIKLSEQKCGQPHRPSSTSYTNEWSQQLQCTKPDTWNNTKMSAAEI